MECSQMGNVKMYECDLYDPRFKKHGNLKSNDIVRKILYRKTICLKCHEIYHIKYSKCPNCGSKTIKQDSNVLNKLIPSKIVNLRAGIPGDSHYLHRSSMYGSFKQDLRDLQTIGKILQVGTGNENDYSDFCPVNIWDLERFYLIGVNLWNYLYGTDLGTFIAILQVSIPHYIPLHRKSLLNEYVRYSYFLFTGYHKKSNKEVLVLSNENKVDIDCLSDLKDLKIKIKRNDNIINLSAGKYANNPLYNELTDAEWYLYFSLGENIIIIPQEQSKLDLRASTDLERLIKLHNISTNYKLKSYFRDWDMDDENSKPFD